MKKMLQLTLYFVLMPLHRLSREHLSLFLTLVSEVGSGCLRALHNRKFPKFAIAQRNWISQLPSHLTNMRYGTLSLLRPIPSCGRMVSYSSTASPTSGTRFTGQLNSTKFNMTLVWEKVPLHPRDSSVKVLLVSPFATDKSAPARAKIASTNQYYIVEPEENQINGSTWKTKRWPKLSVMRLV